MKRLGFAAAMCALVTFPVMAGEKLTKDEVVALVSDSTYQTSTGNQGVINADGTVSASSPRSSSEGTWKVTDDGEYCNSWSNSRWNGSCAAFERTEDANVFVRATPEGSARYTFKKK